MLPSKNIGFSTSRGNELAGRLDLPDIEPRAFALFAHCFACTKDSKAATYISQALVTYGIAVLRFDFTGLGSSGGDFAESNLSSNADDLLAAASYLRSNYLAPQVLIGHSLGGTAVIEVAHDIPEARAIATIGAPFDPSQVGRLLTASNAGIVVDGEATVHLGGRPFTIRKQFVDDLGQHDAKKNIGNLGRALLILHSPLDQMVDIENGSQIFAAAKQPKSFFSLDGADHLLRRVEDAAYAAGVIAAWASRYLGPAPVAP